MRRSHRKASIHHSSPQTQLATSPVAPTSPRETRYAHRYADIGVFDPRQSTGSPLEPDLLRRMEAAFDSDFSDVRLRVPGDTARFEALAMARGDEIHLQTGAFDPHSASGLALLGHELAHIVQQRQGRVPGAGSINADPGLEAEADRAGQAASRGENANLGGVGRASSPASSITSAPIQRVWAKIENGKVQYDVKAPKTDMVKTIQDYTWMEESDFVAFKNAGKRHESNKFTERSTGNHYFSRDGSTYYSDKKMTLQVPSTNVPNSSDLIDRRRKDRQKENIALYDVTSYNEARNRAKKGDAMEHDHVPSGESRKQANPKLDKKSVYNKALAIEIRGKHHTDGSDHASFSPTYGGRQARDDTVNEMVTAPPTVNGSVKKQKTSTTSTGSGTTASSTTPTIKKVTDKRPVIDAKYPGLAFYRDVDTMLTRTEDTKLGRSKTDMLQQMGGYRYLYKKNLAEKVIDPREKGFLPQTGLDGIDKAITYDIANDKLGNNRSQGSLIDEMLNTHLAKRAK
jgi:Domain of unknown function (DUF4157)